MAEDMFLGNLIGGGDVGTGMGGISPGWFSTLLQKLNDPMSWDKLAMQGGPPVLPNAQGATPPAPVQTALQAPTPPANVEPLATNAAAAAGGMTPVNMGESPTSAPNMRGAAANGQVPATTPMPVATPQAPYVPPTEPVVPKKPSLGEMLAGVGMVAKPIVPPRVGQDAGSVRTSGSAQLAKANPMMTPTNDAKRIALGRLLAGGG